MAFMRIRLVGHFSGEWGWRSSESTRLSPMWPGFVSRTRRHVWVDFVVGSRPCSEGFFLRVLRFFPPPQKPTFPNFNSIWISIGATGLSVEDCLVSPSLKEDNLLFFFLLYFFFLPFMDTLLSMRAC